MADRIGDGDPRPPAAQAGGRPASVSLAGLALWVAGAGVLCLALTTAAVALLPGGPLVRAVVALLGVVLTVAVMGLVSRRLTDRALREDADETGVGSGADDGLGLQP